MLQWVPQLHLRHLRQIHFREQPGLLVMPSLQVRSNLTMVAPKFPELYQILTGR